MSSPKKILISRTDRIGDIVLTLPMAWVIKKHIPDAHITFLVKEYTSPLVMNNPFIDDVIILEEIKGKTLFGNNFNKLRLGKFDTVFAVYPRFILAVLFFLCGIRTRIGTGYRWFSFLFNKKIFEHRKYGTAHELIHNINLLKAEGISDNVTENNCVYGLIPDKEAVTQVKDFLNRENINLTKPLIIFHPGSRGSAVDLPVEKMREVIAETANKIDAIILITGDNRETEVCNFVSAGLPVINLCGKFNLAQLTALINESHILVSNSTGPIHIAAALGKNVIGFYPKIPALSPVRWGPYTDKKKVFVPSINCSGCTRKQCEELNCMNSIGSDEIFNAINEIVKKVPWRNK